MSVLSKPRRARPYHEAVKRDMTGFVRAGITVTVLSVLGWLTSCSDGPGSVGSACPPDCPSEDVIVSDPVLAAGLARSAGAGPALAGSAAEVAYVSLPPGTVPAGNRATVRRVGDVGSIIATVFDGGVDPVPVAAQAGDFIDVLVTSAGGGTLFEERVAVRASRRPSVVRSHPPRGKTDVAVNAVIVVVFSEPVSGGTLTPSSVQVLRGTSSIPGTVTLLEGSATAAVFVPAARLDQNTAYQLVVTQAVTDLEGDPLAAAVATEFTTGNSTVGGAASVTVVPDTTVLLAGQQLQLTALARDTLGEILTGQPITWSSDNTAVATVSASGLVTALAEGAALIQADLGGPRGTAVVFVTATLPPVASVEVTPVSGTIPVGGTVKLTAVLRDANGNIVRFRPVGWGSSNPATATVGAGSGETNVVAGVSPGSASVTATSEGKSGTATITVVSPGPYVMVDAGFYSCGVTTGGWAFCWGLNNFGQTGNGTTLNSRVPAAVAGGPMFSRVTAPWGFTSCALTPGGAAYCWGMNADGQLGIGTSNGPEQCSTSTPCSTTPVAVSGGLQFSAIAGGEGYVCALTSSGVSYCWGSNREGRLGIGTTTGPEVCRFQTDCSTVPVAVAGGLTFTALTVGWDHACALTAAGAAYCWGENSSGGLGDGTTTSRSAPVPVAGGLSFVALSAGTDHTCGLTSDGSAYCWGRNDAGQLGDGTTTGSSVPVPVAGGLNWATISAGLGNACAVTPGGVAYCWGDNSSGALGNGTTQSSTIPVPVTGGLVFASVSAGGGHSCGVTVAGIAYCWGANNYGELGTGSTSWTTVPVRVAGQP